MAKGYRGKNKNCIRIAVNRVHKGLEHAYVDRKKKKRDFRRLWITQLSAGLSEHDMKYSTFIHSLNKADIELNRKVLADIAQTEPFSFRAIIETVNQIQGKPEQKKKRIETIEEFIEAVKPLNP